uniref:I/LWEQ domain-containing protein n=1 Tax=Glossina austeni TaxID=7395 RepID=A0A1A9VED1_GLOAU
MDKDSNNLVVSITKALNPTETPLKMKHARNIIIATYRTKEVKSVWSIITRQPLMEHRFTAWKFCHMLHKVMREGHPICLKQSLTHKALILEVGKLWGHLQDGVGTCIESYTKLVVNKLEFHEKNAIFPGSLLLEFNEVEKFAEDDRNVYFQLCVEVFDYLDHIIDVQSKIFASVNIFRMSSMTPQGQCRLAPLITLIQDSNPLYDISVRLMFKLHNGLPSDVLTGHRDRFNDLFSKIKYFYDNVRPLQYFADVIQVPSLPENAPNFLSQIDLGNYVAPTVYVKQDQEEPAENLVDNLTPIENPDLSERDNIIKRLQEELLEKENQLKNEAKLICKMSEVNLKNRSLETELSTIKEKFIELMISNENLETQLKEASGFRSETREWEEKTKSMEEKFEKIKLMYAKLREEHVNLLRMQSEEKRTLHSEKESKACLEMDVKESKFKIEEMQKALNMKTMECENQLADKNLEITKLKSEITQKEDAFKELKSECDAHAVKYQELLKKNDCETELSRKLNDDVNLKQLKYAALLEEKANCEEKITSMNLTIHSITSEKCELDKRLHNLDESVVSLNEELERAKKESDELRRNKNEAEHLLFEAVSSMMKETFKILDCLGDSELTAEKALENIKQIERLLRQLSTEYSRYSKSPNEINGLISTCLNLMHAITTLHTCLVYISNNISDLVKAEDILQNSNEFRDSLKPVYQILSNKRDPKILQDTLESIPSAKLKAMQELMLSLINISPEGHNLEYMLQMELKAMDQIIEEATNKIIEIYSDSKSSNNGIKLEVHDKILDSCTSLMKSIKILIKKSRLLQEEIVAQGKGHFPAKEFYKRNSQWAEGLISASKNIAKGANFLVESANKFFTTESSNNFEIIVAAQEIAASTAQLVIASKVKADKNSQKLVELTKASRDVSQATGSVVAAVKDGNIQLDNFNELELTQLTPSQMKTREMEIHVKVLELEQALQNERYKLMSFRKTCYKNAQED